MIGNYIEHKILTAYLDYCTLILPALNRWLSIMCILMAQLPSIHVTIILFTPFIALS